MAITTNRIKIPGGRFVRPGETFPVCRLPATWSMHSIPLGRDNELLVGGEGRYDQSAFPFRLEKQSA